MSVKKVLLTISAMALIAVIAVAGTLAYLQKSTETIENTFASAGLIDPDQPGEEPNFKLVENEVTNDRNGGFTLNDTETTTGVAYNNILPGTTLPKNPNVTVKSLKQNAYLFIKVEDNLTEGLSWLIDSTNWIKVEGAKLDNKDLPTGTTIYVYTNGTADAAELTSGTTVNAAAIIKDNQVKVDASYVTKGNDGALKFTAYLAQTAGFADSKEAWNSVFGGVTKA